MVAQLRIKRASMVGQIRTLEGELEAALVRFHITKDSIPQYVEELKTMASSLESLCANHRHVSRPS